jgi:hypothetical protein
MTRFPVLLLPLLLCASCAHQAPPQGPTLAGSAVGKIQVHADSAQIHVLAVQKESGERNRERLDTVLGHLNGIKDAADEAERGNEQSRRLIGQLIHDNTVLTTKNEAYKSRWLGDRMLFWMKFIIAGGLITWVVMGVLGSWLMPGKWGKAILSFIPFANPFSRISRRKGT